MRTSLVYAVAFVLAMSIIAPVDAGEWELLGQRKVNFGKDRDTIIVTALEGIFTKIKIRVLYSSIEIFDLKIQFKNGESFDVAIRSTIAAGGESRIIDLPGKNRIIKNVEFIYRSRRPPSGRATVMLFGKHPVSDDGADDNPPQVRQWEKLGTRLVNHGLDRDIIHVGSYDGSFSKIKIKVLRKGLELLDLKVFYANGSVQDISIGRFIDAGDETRVIDLLGGDRIIKRVQFLYRTPGNKPGRSIIQLWGKH